MGWFSRRSSTTSPTTTTAAAPPDSGGGGGGGGRRKRSSGRVGTDTADSAAETAALDSSQATLTAASGATEAPPTSSAVKPATRTAPAAGGGGGGGDGGGKRQPGAVAAGERGAVVDALDGVLAGLGEVAGGGDDSNDGDNEQLAAAVARAGEAAATAAATGAGSTVSSKTSARRWLGAAGALRLAVLRAEVRGVRAFAVDAADGGGGRDTNGGGGDSGGSGSSGAVIGLATGEDEGARAGTVVALVRVRAVGGAANSSGGVPRKVRAAVQRLRRARCGGGLAACLFLLSSSSDGDGSSSNDGGGVHLELAYAVGVANGVPVRGTLWQVLRGSGDSVGDGCEAAVAAWPGRAARAVLASDLTAGLAALHAQGLAHGALDPGMCVVDGGWRLRVVGWFRPCAPATATAATQSAKAVDGDHVLEIAAVTEGAKAGGGDSGGVPAVALAYIAPERLAGYPQSSATVAGDVYSAAVILNEIHAGGPAPYAELAPSELEDLVRRRLRADPAAARPALGSLAVPGLRAAIEQAWAADPRSRPPALRLASAAEAAAASALGGPAAYRTQGRWAVSARTAAAEALRQTAFARAALRWAGSAVAAARTGGGAAAAEALAAERRRGREEGAREERPAAAAAAAAEREA
ncbi:hypothetical protein HK405_010843, partial [Cladochytrium tenue]